MDWMTSLFLYFQLFTTLNMVISPCRSDVKIGFISSMFAVKLRALPILPYFVRFSSFLGSMNALIFSFLSSTTAMISSFDLLSLLKDMAFITRITNGAWAKKNL